MTRAKHQHYPALDGLRAVAVLLVLLVHTMPDLCPWGWVGVQLFFVLSGFLITSILFDTRHRPSRYRDFYLRRVLRIFPLYYAVLIVAALLTRHGTHPRHIWLWFLYLQNFAWFLPGMEHFSDALVHGRWVVGAIGHFWSLAIEEQFYLLWPTVVFFVGSRRRLIWICASGIAGRLVLGVLVQHWAPEVWLQNGIIYRMLPTQCDGFLMGGLLALWLRSPGRKREYYLQYAGYAAIGSTVLYAALIVALHKHPLAWAGDVLDYRSPFQGMIGLPLANLVSLCVLAAGLSPATLVYRLGSVKWLRELGLISYGVYVYHMFLFTETREYVQRVTVGVRFSHIGLWTFLTTFLLTVLVSYASFRWLESPFLRLKDRFAPSHRSVPSGREPELVA